VEWKAVAAGIRRCALKTVPIGRLDQFTQRVVREGLSVVPIEQRRVDATYQAVPIVVGASDEVPDASLHVLCAVARPSDAAESADCAFRSAHVPLGRLLGYPECCTAFFEYQWSRRRLIDPTWPMACATPGARIDGSTCHASGHWTANVLLRWTGVRAVPHLPCSFACARSHDFGRALLALAADLSRDTDTVAHWEDMLRWPVAWTARRGSAEIRVPVLTVGASTDEANDDASVVLTAAAD
jgi:hypothetical protein